MNTNPELINRTNLPSTDHSFQSRSVLVSLFLMGVICLFYGIREYRSFGLHEVHAVATSRTMLITGDYVVPYEAGEPRLAKPPLGYWIIAASAKLTGRVDEFSARLPAAIFALLLSGLMGFWAARWYGKKTGYLTAFAQATAYYTMLWARKTEVDMCLTLVNVAALYLIASQPSGQVWKQGFLRWTGIFALLGISVLAKFYYGPVLVFGITGAYWLLQGRHRDLIHLLNPIGWILLIGPFAVWAVMVSRQLPDAWAIWKYETIGRATGQIGNAPVWYFIPILVWITLPWTPVWLLELKQSWRLAWSARDPQERFLWAWFMIPFAIVSLQPDKHANYMMTFLPVFSILTGRRLAAELTRDRWLSLSSSKLQAAGLTVLNIACGSIAVYAILREWSQAIFVAASTAILIVIGMSAVTWLFYLRRQQAGAVLLCACYSAFTMIYFGGIQPIRDPLSIHADFCQEVYRKNPDTQIFGYGLNAGPNYYLGPNLLNFTIPNSKTIDPITQSEFISQLENRSDLLLVSTEDRVEELEQYGTLIPVFSVDAEAKANWDGRYSLPICWRLKPFQNLQVTAVPDRASRQ